MLKYKTEIKKTPKKLCDLYDTIFIRKSQEQNYGIEKFRTV